MVLVIGLMYLIACMLLPIMAFAFYQMAQGDQLPERQFADLNLQPAKVAAPNRAVPATATNPATAA